MTAKEKALEIFNNFKQIEHTIFGCNERSNPCIISSKLSVNVAKQCALIHVHLLINELSKSDLDNVQNIDQDFQYWNQVILEIEHI